MTDVVVIAPHRDGEALGCGGLLACAADPLVVFGVESRAFAGVTYAEARRALRLTVGEPR